jgi:hypothetical protein
MKEKERHMCDEEEEEGNERSTSFKKHFDEKMRMPFFIARSFLLEIKIIETKTT